MLATAWVQSHPLVDAREAADEVPRSWELDVAEIKARDVHQEMTAQIVVRVSEQVRP